MSKLTELSREQFNDFKKIKPLSSPLYGDYMLFGRKGSKFIGKPLEFTFTSTRTASIPYYVTENKTKTYFFELQGESLDSILQNKLVISNRLNSKHNNSELICWMTKYKNFQMNLWEIFKLGVKVITSTPIQIILSCFRLVRGKLAYQYDSWYVSTQVIARNNIQELQKFYFSQNSLKNIRDGVIAQLSQSEALYRLAFLILHLGTRDLNLRFYEYGLYQLSHQNMTKRLECFKKRYFKLGMKIQGILTDYCTLQDYAALQELSSINIDNTIMRNFNSSSVESLRRSQQKSTGKVKLILEHQHQQQQQSKKKIRMKTQESKILHLECSTLNLLDKMRGFNWGVLPDDENTTVLQNLNLQQYYPVTTYQQKVVRLLGKIHLKIVYSKKIYSNGSVYIGELLQDSREGKGLYLFESGDIYYGDWKSNNMHGFGAYLFKNGDSYQGQLEGGLKQGHGKNEYSSGNIYEGSWIGNQKKGLGVVHYKNGSMFVGQFFGNQKAAQGVHISSDGSLIEGRSQQQNLSPGKTKLKPIRLTLAQNSLSAICQIFPDGQYSGDIVEGRRQGFGTLKNQNQAYEGNWKNNLKHGKGKLHINNLQIEGVWENGFIVSYS